MPQCAVQCFSNRKQARARTFRYWSSSRAQCKVDKFNALITSHRCTLMSHSDSSASTADDVALMWATNDRASKCKRCSSPALFRTCCDTYVCNACYFSENICPLCKTGTTAMSLSPTPVEKPNRLASRCAMLPAFALMILPIALMAQYILMQQNITLTLIEVEGCAPGAERRIVCVKASALQGETGNPRDADRGSWARCEEDSPFVSERLPTS